MISSILVALDGTSSSLYAARAALNLAARFRCHMTVIGIANLPWIQQAEPVPLGAGGYKAGMDRALLEASERRVKDVFAAFHTEAASVSIDVQARLIEGDALKVLQEELTAHDILVVARDADFDAGHAPPGLSPIIDDILRTEPRPVLLVPSGWTEHAGDAPVVMAFDGSPASSRALHIFALLGLAEGRRVHVVTMKDTRDEAEAVAASACLLLSRHGCRSANAVGFVETGNLAQTILETANTLDASLLVIGAYGKRGFQRMFGSCTRSILETSTIPLLIHH